MNNYDRIFTEIRNEAEQYCSETGLGVDELVGLVIEIVNLEDQHRLRAIRINQLVEEKIENVARRRSV